MGLMSVFRRARPELAGALIAILAAGGCGSSGEVGDLGATPATPPPGRSGKDRAAAIKAGRAEMGKEEFTPKKAPGARRRPPTPPPPEKSE
jgi:hypothetical protein